MTEPTVPSATPQRTSPHATVKSLEKLVGTWILSGETDGKVTYEWMEGGFFLMQRVDMEYGGHRIKGLEIIGQLRPFGGAPSAEIRSRFYSAAGDTLDYVYELSGDTLTIWGGERDSPAYYRGTFSEDGSTCDGAWVFPGGGGYTTTMTRVRHESE